MLDNIFRYKRIYFLYSRCLGAKIVRMLPYNEILDSERSTK